MTRTKQAIFWGYCSHPVVLASDYVQAAAVETVHNAHHWLRERPGFRCVCQRRTHSKLVRPQLQHARQPVVCPYAGERAESSLCDVHAMTNVSVISAVTLHYRPPDTRTSAGSRAECCRRTPRSAEPQQHAALQSAQLYRPASLNVSAASHHHHTSELCGSSIIAALETFGGKRRTYVLASELQPRPPPLS